MSAASAPTSAERADELRRRREALARFDRWREANERFPTAQAALSGVGFLYDLLPAKSRRRGADPSGVAKMHASLAVLGTSGRR